MNRLDDVLIKEKWINPNELIKAREDQRKTKKSIFCSLIKLGYMNEDDVFRFFAINSYIPFIKLSDYTLKEEVLALLDEDFCRKHVAIPLFKVDNSLFVVMANPLDADLIMSLADRTGLDIEPLISSKQAILKALDERFGYDDSFFEIENFLFKPEGLHKFPFHRDSERLSLNIPAEFRIDDDNIKLASSQYLPANAFDVSRNGKALGVTTLLFIPPKTRLQLRFKDAKGKNRETKAEVVYSRMKKEGDFLMGLKLLESEASLISFLLKSAGS